MILARDEDARTWIAAAFDVSRETLARLDAFAALLRAENERQNLVSRTTLDQLWVRHFADSAQLLLHRPAADAPWLDIGSGAGFPGLIVAALHEGPVTLVEPRKLRVAFLEQAAAVLGVRPVIRCAKAERLPPQPYGVVSARAVAPLEALIRISRPFSTEKTRLIFPKGRKAASELAQAQSAWQGAFRLAPSLTDADAGIVIAEGLHPRRAFAPQRESA